MAELVGGAILNAFLNVLFERMATPEFMDLVVTQKMDRNMLLKLKTYLTTVNAVLFDAEYRQIALKDASVKYFLGDLRDAAFGADDLMDLIAYEVTAAEIHDDQRATAANLPWSFSSLLKLLSKQVCSINHSGQLSIPSSVTMKIEQIVEMLEILVKQIDPLGLKMDHRKCALPQRELTTSVVEQSEIVGRDSEVDALLDSLEVVDENGIGVIPIFGMGGIGKTTLAGLIYNHSKVKELFEIRAWVCVSDNYDGFRIKKELLQQVNDTAIAETDQRVKKKLEKLSSRLIDEKLKKNSEELSPQQTDEKKKRSLEDLSPQQIEEALNKSLAGKKYLIVLDDVWDNRYDNWNKLQATLKSGGKGSKILVTTRNKNIALMMSTVGELSSSELKLLNDNSCWQIFVKHAFNSEEDDENKQSLREMVVRNCGGLPLAAKMLGGVMRGKQMAEWDTILKSEMWDIDCGVIPALMLSYQYLPSHLKQCFSYCAIFPQDYKIRKEELIQLWMAECFVVKSRRGGDNLELGEKYVKELVSRCFLQEHNDANEGSYFLMHDLINELAQHISGEFLVRMDADDSCKFSTRNRYLSFKISEENSSNMAGSICKAQFLRTFWSFGGEYVGYKEVRKIVDDVVNDLQCLRVLNLHNFKVKKLSKSIRHLKHLRYVNLTGALVKRIPNTVCSLHNLETLILYQCKKLAKLPKNIGNLINLLFLDIRETPRLRKMPPRIGNLKDLRTLSKFIVGKQNGFGIDELRKLQHLRGELHITNLKNVGDIREDSLKDKRYLEDLTLEWERKSMLDLVEYEEVIEILEWESRWRNERDVNSEFDERVLERLQPCESIKKLSIIGYGGTKLSDWVGDSSYTNILSLKLIGCTHCTILPEFDKLLSLEHLSILNCDAVAKISMTKSLCSLKTLSIENMKQWEEWCFGEPGQCGSLAKLEELTIKHCPKLKVISWSEPKHMIFYCLKNLKIGRCYNLESFPEGDLSGSLESLEIRKCNDQLISGWCWEKFNSLTRLHLNKYYGGNSDCFPSPPNLTSLEISQLGELKFAKCIDFQHLTELIIKDCDNLESLAERGLGGGVGESESVVETHSLPMLPNLRIIQMWNCNGLMGRRMQWGLHRFKALSIMFIGDYDGDDLYCFPEESLLPSCLTSLTFANFKKLNVINHKGLQHLTSLSRLQIVDCPKVRCLPEEGLPSSISYLSIAGSDLLKARCKRGKGQDWPKISHISNIKFEYSTK